VKGAQTDEPQVCAVVDHPKLEHQWLWDIFKKRENVAIDDLFDESEDLPPPLPKQEMTKPEFVIDVPPVDTAFAEEGTFDLGDFTPPPQPINDWKATLGAIEYDPVAREITKVDMTGVKGVELGSRGWRTLHSAPDPSAPAGEPFLASDEAARDAVKTQLLETAEALTIDAGYAAGFKDRVYGALIQHVRQKFLNGSSLGLAERSEVSFAWKMLSQVKSKVGAIPGLVAGMIEYGDQ
jgi:type III restriction enzyme